MNELFFSLGLEAWKPVLTALVLPPVPMLVLMLFSARLLYRRALLGWLLMLLAVVTMWLSCTEAVAGFLMRNVMRPPPALISTDLAELKRSPKTAIVILGGGRRVIAPEFGLSNLKPRTAERLRYGIWLSRETGLPMAFSGGVGHGALEGPSEAEIAGRVAEREFGRPIRWLESESRDTRENAFRTIAMLRPMGIEKIVLVTHDYHMRRSVANFERAAEGSRIAIVPAPMGVAAPGRLRASDWLPSVEGFEDNWIVARELLGRFSGA